MNLNPLPVILSAVGIYFLVKLRFFFILHPFRTLGKTYRAVKDSRALKSLTLALAGTLGVGNVFGVAVGIIIGGAGSLFWLFVSMIFAMAIKYAEVVVSSDNLYHDGDSHGGMSYVIRRLFPVRGGAMSSLYALSVLCLSLFMGAALQCGTVAESVSAISDIPGEAVALLLVIMSFTAIIGGTSKIEKITAIISPMTTIIYIIATLSMIIINGEALPSAIDNIFKSAFRPPSALGGVLGFLLSAPFHEGFSRGILSNEAGAGTSSMAHARSGILNPAQAGLVGIFEVWFDTGLICMLTGLAILTSVPDVSGFRGGMELIMYAVGVNFGSVGKVTVMLCVLAFAFATVICWYYYGMESWAFAFGKRGRIAFLPLFLSFILLGGVMSTYFLISVIDLLMAVVTVLTVAALIKSSDRIKTLSERGGVMKYNVRRLKGSVSRTEASRRGKQ